MKSVRAKRRAEFARLLRGEGLEIGALLDPLPVPYATRVWYSDLLTPEQLDEMYPGSAKPDIVSDSESFPSIADHSFDFVVANHVLEHVTDPLRALMEWHRMLRPDGLLMLTLPDKRFTFDATRKRTTLEHLLDDHASAASPAVRNRVHLEEWAEHVERLRPGSPAYRRWIDDQLAHGYAVHNHVWIPRDILEVLEWLDRNGTHFAVERVANASPLTNEFAFLLRRAEAGERLHKSRGLRARLLLADPWLDLAAIVKRVLRRLLTR